MKKKKAPHMTIQQVNHLSAQVKKSLQVVKQLDARLKADARLLSSVAECAHLRRRLETRLEISHTLQRQVDAHTETIARLTAQLRGEAAA